MKTMQTGQTASARATHGDMVAAELVNARELARLLAISERTLYRLKSMGELPSAVILGGSVRWRLTEVREWIAKGCPSTPQD